MNKLERQLLCMFLFVILAMFAIGIALRDDSSSREEAAYVQSTVDAKQDSRIEQLEKEIRILRTDLMLVQKEPEEEK